MKHSIYTSYDELPLMLSVPEVAAVLGISRAGAYHKVGGHGVQPTLDALHARVKRFQVTANAGPLLHTPVTPFLNRADMMFQFVFSRCPALFLPI